VGCKLGFLFLLGPPHLRQRLRRRDMVVMLFGNDAKWSHALTVLSATLLLALEDGRVSVCVFQLQLSVLLPLAPVTRHHGETRAVLTQPPHGSELRTCFDRLPVRTNEATSELFSHWYDVTVMTQSSNSPCTSAGEARLSAMTIDPKLTVSQPSRAITRTQHACCEGKPKPTGPDGSGLCQFAIVTGFARSAGPAIARLRSTSLLLPAMLTFAAISDGHAS
jgi:hypothetical protein